MRAFRVPGLLMGWFLSLVLATPTFAKDLYLAQTAVGVGDGSSAANTFSVAWFNTSSNWGTGSGKISPGDTVHLCGIINTELEVWGSGTAGSVITFFFEPNAKLSQPAGALLDCGGRNYLVFDGGSNGIIENTDNGTVLGNQIDATGINAPESSNIEVRNLTIQNLYVHTAPSDSFPAHKIGSGVYLNGFGNNISIHDCTFHDIGWVLVLASENGATGVNIYNNTFYNYDHGVAGFGGTMGSPANVNIHDNQFGSTANWDTMTDAFHHDGIHIFFAPGGLLSGVNIYNNLFSGNWGANNTAHIYIQGDYSQANPNAVSNVAIWDNVFIEYPGDAMNNGFLAGNGSDWRIQNNTFVGTDLRNSTAIYVGGPGLAMANNLFTSVTTFVNVASGTTFAAGGTNNNLYADATPGGNPTWMVGGVACTTFASWQSAIGQEAQSLMAAAANVNPDGTLQNGSPAIGAGTNFSSFFTTDKNGAARTVPWDIGAYKFGVSKPAAPKNLRIVPQ